MLQPSVTHDRVTSKSKIHIFLLTLPFIDTAHAVAEVLWTGSIVWEYTCVWLSRPVKRESISVFAIDHVIFQEPLRELQDICISHQFLMATAESCTGGLLSALLTNRPGSSGFFLGGVNAYANSIKIRILGVPEDQIKQYGAVSTPVAQSMAAGVQKLFQVQFSCSITGVAGPGGGTVEKPVGLVCFGWSTPDGTSIESHRFSGSREDIRAASCYQALLGMLQRVHAYAQKGVS
jgi:nicotinamide-nucleotide amidase